MTARSFESWVLPFPGGKMDQTDVSPLAAAMRETEEEIGLDRQFVDPIGYLDLRFAFSGFRILPVVAHVTPGYSLALNAPEVAEAFEVPLAFLMTPTNHQFVTRKLRAPSVTLASRSMTRLR